jgi:hypothetical protein
MARTWWEHPWTILYLHVQPKKRGANWEDMADPCNCKFSLYFTMICQCYMVLCSQNHSFGMVSSPCIQVLQNVLIRKACQDLPPLWCTYYLLLNMNNRLVTNTKTTANLNSAFAGEGATLVPNYNALANYPQFPKLPAPAPKLPTPPKY